MASKKRKKRLALGREKRANSSVVADGCVQEQKNAPECKDRPTSSQFLTGGECVEPAVSVAVGPSQCSVSTALSQHMSSLAASPNSLHNLTVTYHYHQSPISSSTRSLSELSSVLPSDGLSLKNICPVKTSPSLPLLSCKHTAPSPTSSRTLRKRLKISSDSPQSADVQRLLSIASILCHTNHENIEADKPSSIELSSDLEGSKDDMILSHFPLSPQNDVGDDIVASEDDDVGDDDKAFWTQAADMVEGREWEMEGGEGERDSAFLDEVLSSSLLLTPLLSGSQTHNNQSTPHTNHSPCTSTHHSTPPTHHLSPSVNTPLSHRHGTENKPHPHPLF